MNLVEELKRRNVFRVALAYLVTSWLLLQVADIVLENIDAPGWVIQAFMLALVLGLPIALIFAWAFELTPEGIRKEKDVDRTRSITPQTGRKLDLTIIGVLAIAVVILLFDRFSGTADPEPEQLAGQGTPAETLITEAGQDDDVRSIAVLPFVNMSSDPEQEYFSDGISEEILNALAKVSELKVAGRTSSFAFKGKNQDLRQIGDTLGVEHILEGSVRKAGATVRITAQLIQVDDGFHLWSETYDRELTDVFAIQDEIAGAILEQLKTHLVGGDSVTLEAAARTDSEAYDLYLLARQRIYERKRLSIESAAGLLDQAIARDPGYAPAYAQRGIAALLLSERNYGEMTLAESGERGRKYIDRALELDPQLAEGWAGLGLYHTNRPGEHLQAIEALEKALAINPNLIDASNWLQVAYGESGDNARALAILEGMIERDPLYPPGINNAVNVYNLFGKQARAQALIERVRPFMQNDPTVLQAEASIWISLGKPSRALPLLETALAQQPTDAVMRTLLSFGLLQTGQYDRLAKDGQRWARVVGLTQIGRIEEGSMLASTMAAEGNVGILFWHLARTGQPEQLLAFFESRWTDLDAFEAGYPDGGSGYSDMLHIAWAYAATDSRPERFRDAMQRVEAAHARALEQGVDDASLWRDEARYHTLAGDFERASESLERAVESGLLVGDRLAAVWPELHPLSGDPRYEALQARIFERLNAERATLNLEPLDT